MKQDFDAAPPAQVREQYLFELKVLQTFTNHVSTAEELLRRFPDCEILKVIEELARRQEVVVQTDTNLIYIAPLGSHRLLMNTNEAYGREYRQYITKMKSQLPAKAEWKLVQNWVEAMFTSNPVYGETF